MHSSSSSVGGLGLIHCSNFCGSGLISSSLSLSLLQNEIVIFINRKLKHRWHHDGCILGFDDGGTVDDVAVSQQFGIVDRRWAELTIFYPVSRSLAFKCRCVRRLLGLRVSRKFRFRVVHGGAQYQVKHVHAPLRISRNAVVDPAVLILKSFIYRHDVGCTINKQERRHKTEDIELAAVLGFYLKTKLNGLKRKALIGNVLDRSLLHALYRTIEDIVIFKTLHCYWSQQRKAQRLFVQMEDVHCAFAKGTEHRRE